MHKKFITTPIALAAVLALAGGPVGAQGTADESDPETTVVPFECPADDGSEEEPGPSEDVAPAEEPGAEEHLDIDEIDEEKVAEIRAVAEEAGEGVDTLLDHEEEVEVEADDDTAESDNDGDEDGRDRAKESLQAAVDRLCETGAGGNGVAAAVLTALINGESPSGISAGHGKAIAEEAKDRRGQRQDGKKHEAPGQSQRPDKADSTDEEDVDIADGKEDPDKKGRPEHAGPPDHVGPSDDDAVVDTEPKMTDTDDKKGPPAHAGNGGKRGSGR